MASNACAMVCAHPVEIISCRRLLNTMGVLCVLCVLCVLYVMCVLCVLCVLCIGQVHPLSEQDPTLACPRIASAARLARVPAVLCAVLPPPRAAVPCSKPGDSTAAVQRCLLKVYAAA